MCLYIETDPSKTATSWSTADTKCNNMGMRLVSNITPIKMEALVNITRKNPSIIGYIYIGMRRKPQTDTGTLQWLDDQPVDMAALGPYWGSGEPDGSATSEHCVVIDTDRRSGLSDVPCGTKHPFVCELLKP
ncbi:C-type lectin domain family 6 member A-like [Littorina saxatilis]|uniref:C-type lectin domain family 6 member A-like n=1 Tax=Littorina saxatilis TaxID=31220 RepID=UPI0038B5DA46